MLVLNLDKSDSYRINFSGGNSQPGYSEKINPGKYSTSNIDGSYSLSDGREMEKVLLKAVKEVDLEHQWNKFIISLSDLQFKKIVIMETDHVDNKELYD